MSARHPDDADTLPEVAQQATVVGPVDDHAGVLARLRRIDRKLLLASLALTVGVLFIAVGLLRAVTGDDVTNLPSAIDGIRPAPDDEQVLQQTQVTVDLAEGYEGELIVDGLALPTVRLDQLSPVDVEPGQQIEVPPGAMFEPGNGTLTFTPAEGTAIETFDPGSHSVIVRYWTIEEGPDAARSYGWTFEVI